MAGVSVTLRQGLQTSANGRLRGLSFQYPKQAARVGASGRRPAVRACPPARLLQDAFGSPCALALVQPGAPGALRVHWGQPGTRGQTRRQTDAAVPGGLRLRTGL